MPVQVKRTRSQPHRRSRTQRPAGVPVRRSSTSGARSKKLIRKGALRMFDGGEWIVVDAYLRKSLQSKVELTVFHKLKVDDKESEDRVVKLRLLLRQVVAMEKHLPPDDSGVHPIVLFTPDARHCLGAVSEAEREAWSRDLAQFTGRDYFFAVTVPPQEAFLPQPPAGVARLHLNPNREVLLLTVNTSQPSLPTVVNLWSFDSIQSFGATESLLVIQTSSQADARNYCCFVSSAAEEIADHLSRLMPEEGTIYDTIKVESGSEDSSCNESGDEAESENRDVAEKDRGSRLRKSYLKAVDKVSDSELLESNLHLPQQPTLRPLSPPVPLLKKKFTTKWKRKDSPSITVTSDEGQIASPVAQIGTQFTGKSPLLGRFHGSGEMCAPPSEVQRSPSGLLSTSAPPGDPPRSPSPIKRLKRLKRWLSPNLMRKGPPKAPIPEGPVALMKRSASLTDSWDEGINDRNNPTVSPLPSPFFRRKFHQEPVESDSHSESSRDTPTSPPLVFPLHSSVSNNTGRTTPDLTTTLRSTTPDEDSGPGEGVGHDDGHPSVVSEESCVLEEGLPGTKPVVLVGGEDGLSSFSSSAVSQTDRFQQPSQDESKQLSLQDESKQPSLQDESKQPSLQDESRQPSLQDESKQPSLQDKSGQPTNPPDPVPPDTHQVEQSVLTTQRPLPTQTVCTDQTLPAETSLPANEVPPTLQPMGRVLSENTFVHPESPRSPRPFSADCEHLMARARSGSFSELIQSIFVDNLESPIASRRQSDGCHSPLSLHSHSFSDVSGQLETEVWPEMGTDLDDLVALTDRKGDPLSKVHSPSSHPTSQMASLSLEVSQSSSDPDAQALRELPTGSTFNFQGSLVRMRKVPRKSTVSIAMPSPPTAPHWRRRSKSASHALPKRKHSFLDRPLPRLPSMSMARDQVNPPPKVQLESSSEYVNTAVVGGGLYENTAVVGGGLYENTAVVGDDMYENSLVVDGGLYENAAVVDEGLYANVDHVDKIYDEIDFYRDLSGPYVTLAFACDAARQFREEESKSTDKPAPASGSEGECIYAIVDPTAMEAARQLAVERRTEQEDRSRSQTFSTDGQQRRRHASDFNTMRAGGPKTRRQLRRAQSSVGLANEQVKTHTE